MSICLEFNYCRSFILKCQDVTIVPVYNQKSANNQNSFEIKKYRGGIPFDNKQIKHNFCNWKLNVCVQFSCRFFIVIICWIYRDCGPWFNMKVPSYLYNQWTMGFRVLLRRHLYFEPDPDHIWLYVIAAPEKFTIHHRVWYINVNILLCCDQNIPRDRRQ